MTAPTGVVVRADGVLKFVPATVAVHIAPAPRVTEIPGAPARLLGVALHEGSVLPVVSIGAARREMLVCRCAGEQVGVVGCEVVRSGRFASVEGDPGAVDLDGTIVGPLDLETLIAQVRAAGRPTLMGPA